MKDLTELPNDRDKLEKELESMNKDDLEETIKRARSLKNWADNSPFVGDKQREVDVASKIMDWKKESDEG